MSYRAFTKTLEAVSRNAPTMKPPKELNYHLYQPGPFRKVGSPVFSMRDPFLLPNKIKSERHAAAVFPTDPKSTFASDVPLPNVLKRESAGPNACLTAGSALGKVLGYRIIVTGRRGSRSSKQVISFGKLDSRKISSSWLDYGSSHLVTKKGSMGVRVWILYSSEAAQE